MRLGRALGAILGEGGRGRRVEGGRIRADRARGGPRRAKVLVRAEVEGWEVRRREPSPGGGPGSEQG